MTASMSIRKTQLVPRHSSRPAAARVTGLLLIRMEPGPHWAVASDPIWLLNNPYS